MYSCDNYYCCSWPFWKPVSSILEWLWKFANVFELRTYRARDGLAKIWGREKFRILAEISAIFALDGAFSRKISENFGKYWKIDFFKNVLNSFFDHFFTENVFLKVSFAQKLRFQLNKKNLVNPRHENFGTYFTSVPPQFWPKHFCSFFHRKCFFFMCLYMLCANTLLGLGSANGPIKALRTQYEGYRTCLREVRAISSQIFPHDMVENWGEVKSRNRHDVVVLSQHVKSAKPFWDTSRQTFVSCLFPEIID